MHPAYLAKEVFAGAAGGSQNVLTQALTLAPLLQTQPPQPTPP